MSKDPQIEMVKAERVLIHLEIYCATVSVLAALLSASTHPFSLSPPLSPAANLAVDLPAPVGPLLHHHRSPDTSVPLKRGTPIFPTVGSLVETLEVVHHDAEEREVERRDPRPGRGLVVARIAVMRGKEVPYHLNGLFSQF